MKCFFCGYSETKVIDTRQGKNGTTIRRRRECEQCKKRFTTYETVEEFLPFVIKKNGSREQFSREKLISSIITACKKRPVKVSEIYEFVDNFYQNLQNKFIREISTKSIGRQVVEFLKNFDHVAYIRFASVYFNFKNIDEFLKEIETLLNGES